MSADRRAQRAAPTLRTIGIGGRVALAFAAIAALLLALGPLVMRQERATHRATQRVLEEERESILVGRMSQELRSLRTLLRWRADPNAPLTDAEQPVVQASVEVAAEIVARLSRGPDGKDPSQAAHEREERAVYAEIERALAELRAPAPAARSAEAIDAAVARAERAAAVLEEETRQEALAASADLEERGRVVRRAVQWTTAGALAVLVLVLFLVQRSVVRPIVSLSAGARRLARGDLSHREPVRSQDEIGTLATEFNRMATELEGMRAGLEQTVRLRTQEALRAARLAGLGTLAAGVAHEINNPLASIASCAEGLERRLEDGGASPAQQREYLQIIAREAYRAHEITSRLLEYAHTGPTEDRPFSLPALLREIGVLLEHELAARSLSLDVQCAPDVGEMHGDPGECKQVLLNLLHNAIDASPEGGVVRVACRREGDEAVLEVEDQGPGIPAADRERIFDPFYTTKPAGEGTGLGLAIVERIVRERRGRIEVLDTGHGALLRVRVPHWTAGAA